MPGRKPARKGIEQIVLTPSGTVHDTHVKCDLHYFIRVKKEDGTESVERWKQIIPADSLKEGLYNCLEFFEDL